MRPKNVADWAEVISAFAVVISLFYLAFSVQQNTDAVRASALNNVTTDIGTLMQVGASKEIATITMKARNDAPLSETEKEQFLYWFFQNIALTESAWLHREQSRIDGGYYETMVPFLCYVVDNKTGREIWFKWKDSITEAFWLETMEKCGFEKAYVTTISSPKSAMKAMN